MSFEEKYFREELDYLRQLGKLLAKEKPHLAPFLAEKEADPDVERLLEARGHTVRPSMTMGSTQSIMIEGDRFLGAADTRRPDALALGVQ